jgi:hypothetical protein
MMWMSPSGYNIAESTGWPPVEAVSEMYSRKVIGIAKPAARPLKKRSRLPAVISSSAVATTR